MGLRVLVVDDDPTSRMMINRILLPTRAVVTEAGDGSEALMAVEEQDPDLLILDLNMPMVDGFKVMRALRASVRHKNLPIVCVSSSNTVADILRAKEFNVEDYILKPFRTAEAEARLKSVLERTAGWREGVVAVEAEPDLN